MFFLPPSLIRFWIFSDLKQRNKSKWPNHTVWMLNVLCIIIVILMISSLHAGLTLVMMDDHMPAIDPLLLTLDVMVYHIRLVL